MGRHRRRDWTPEDERKHPRDKQGRWAGRSGEGWLGTISGQLVGQHTATLETDWSSASSPPASDWMRALDAQVASPVTAGAKRKPTAGDLLDRVKAEGGQIEDSQAMIPDVAAVIDGEYAGLRVETRRVIGDEDGVDFTARVFKGDEQIGVVRHLVGVDPDGHLWAELALLKLQPEVQGQGFAEAFNAHLAEWYRESGVERIELHADIDVGGYSWARAGYDFRDGMVPLDIVRRLEVAGGRIGRQDYFIAPIADMPDLAARGVDPRMPGVVLLGPNDDVIGAYPTRSVAEAALDAIVADATPDPEVQGLLDRIERGETVSAYEISQLGRRPGMGRSDSWIGKTVMLGSEWYGVRWL